MSLDESYCCGAGVVPAGGFGDGVGVGVLDPPIGVVVLPAGWPTVPVFPPLMFC